MQEIKVVSAGGVDIFYLRELFTPKAAFFDMDSTIVAAETLDEMAEMAGVGEEVREITRLAMWEGADFNDSLRRRLAMLNGVKADDLLEPVYKAMRLNPGAQDLIRTLKENDVKCVLLSGGFSYFTEKVAERLGMDAHHGNVLDIDDDGCLTGMVANNSDIVNGERKAQYLREYCEKWDIDPSDCFAMGDGANDIPMMKLAGLGIAYRPMTDSKAEQEMENVIRHGDLATALKVFDL